MRTSLLQAALVAAIVWGPVPGCASVKQQYVGMPPPVLGQSNPPCGIDYNRRRYFASFGKLCSVTIHEWGHLVGFRDPRNTADPDHSIDPGSIMYFKYTGPDLRCRDFGWPYIHAHRDRDPRFHPQPPQQ